MKQPFVVEYLDLKGQEQTTTIVFDTADYEPDDFLGGSAQEAIEDIFTARFPGCEWIQLILPEDFFEDAE